MWRVLLVALSALGVSPLLWSAYVPIADLAEHAAVIATLRHWNDPAFGFQEFYALDLGRTQYLLLYLGGVVLDLATGSAENALRAWLVLAGCSLPLSRSTPSSESCASILASRCSRFRCSGASPP